MINLLRIYLYLMKMKNLKIRIPVVTQTLMPSWKECMRNSKKIINQTNRYQTKIKYQNPIWNKIRNKKVKNKNLKHLLNKISKQKILLHRLYLNLIMSVMNKLHLRDNKNSLIMDKMRILMRMNLNQIRTTLSQI